MNQNNQNTLHESLNILKKDLFTVPNLLCYLRLLLIPLFVILYMKAETAKEYLMAAFVVMIASFTDFLDGFIARKYNLVTEFGKFLDPLADKLMQAALLCVLILKIDSMYLLVILFVFKEITMAVIGYHMLKKGKKLDGAKWFGKLSTTVFYVIMLVFVGLPNMNELVIKTLMIICGAFLTLSFILYLREYYYMHQELKSKE